MARGWESKSVEAQQDERARADAERSRPPVEDVRRASQRAVLALARSRAAAQLDAATHPAHRAMLESAIRDLDEQMAALR